MEKLSFGKEGEGNSPFRFAVIFRQILAVGTAVIPHAFFLAFRFLSLLIKYTLTQLELLLLLLASWLNCKPRNLLLVILRCLQIICLQKYYCLSSLLLSYNSVVHLGHQQQQQQQQQTEKQARVHSFDHSALETDRQTDRALHFRHCTLTFPAITAR